MEIHALHRRMETYQHDVITLIRAHFTGIQECIIHVHYCSGRALVHPN